jgi:hypothetical protein
MGVPTSAPDKVKSAVKSMQAPRALGCHDAERKKKLPLAKKTTVNSLSQPEA